MAIKTFNTQKKALLAEALLHWVAEVDVSEQYFNQHRARSTKWAGCGRKHRKGKTHSEESKKKMSDSLKGRVSPNKGKKASDETRQKQSKAKIGSIPWNKGSKESEEQCRLKSERVKGKRNPNFGKSWTIERKEKSSTSLKNLPKITCPHCGKEGGFNGMKSWHFDNCRTINKTSHQQKKNKE